MELVSSWANGKTLPKSYIFPPGKRPGTHVPTITQKKHIPIVDIGKIHSSQDDHKKVIQQLMEAAKDFGFSQVINHGISRNLMDDTRGVLKEFFELPIEDKLRFCSLGPNRSFRLYTSNVEYENEDIHYWRDATTHFCTPLEKCMLDWPEKPPTYREVVGNYISNINDLGSRILELLGEGLGLEEGYFAKNLPLDHVLTVNHYPPCPDPSLTLGDAKHCDPDLITILLQDDVPGLQVLHEGRWLDVEPDFDALVINVGFILQMVSNGKLRSAEHRVLTHPSKVRETAAFFIGPKDDSIIIQPAEELVSKENRPMYKAVQFKDLMVTHKLALRSEDYNVIEPYKVNT